MAILLGTPSSHAVAFPEEARGQGVRVAVVDSGINCGRLKDYRGIDLTSSESGLSDNIGHGTACVHIVADKAPLSEIVLVKVFDRALECQPETLCRALEWALDNQVDIVNISMGTTDPRSESLLGNACRRATNLGLMIVAAADNFGRPSYPAVVPQVLGVSASSARGRFDYFYESQHEIQCLAFGGRQRLQWGDKGKFQGGTSFATAHLTGILACLFSHAKESEESLWTLLQRHSLRAPPAPVVDRTTDLIVGYRATRFQRKLECVRRSASIDWIKKAIVYPINKETHSLLHFRERLPFEIVHAVNPLGTATLSAPELEFLGIDGSFSPLQGHLGESLKTADTLILGHLSSLSEARGRDLLGETLDLALRQGASVYSLGAVVGEEYEAVRKGFDERGLRCQFPCVTVEEAADLCSYYDRRVPSHRPILGVFGTSSQQGKFTVQLYLRYAFEARGYSVAHLSTEHQGDLHGATYTFPNGFGSALSVEPPMDSHISILQSVMVAIESEGAEIVIVGGQAGVVPHNSPVKSSGYTLPSIVVLLATRPDLLLLAVNETDESDYVLDTIAVAERISGGRVVGLVSLPIKREEIRRHGRRQIARRKLQGDEMDELKGRMEREVGLQLFEIGTAKETERLADLIISHFA